MVQAYVMDQVKTDDRRRAALAVIYSETILLLNIMRTSLCNSKNLQTVFDAIVIKTSKNKEAQRHSSICNSPQIAFNNTDYISYSTS